MDNNLTRNVYIGFDFSMNKPAATIYYNKTLYFYFWPLVSINDKNMEKYENANITVHSRNLESIKDGSVDTTALVLIHTIRSTDLANMIIADIDELLNTLFSNSEDYDLYVCSEGLSFTSKGDATLDLATYKGVLLSNIYVHYGDHLKRLFTYAPNTLKATAGCATKELRKDKINMINSFMREPLDIPFIRELKNGSLVKKKNYMDGIDDLVDSYWALKTMIMKENLKY